MQTVRHFDENIAVQVARVPSDTAKVLGLASYFGSLFIVGSLAALVAYLLWPVHNQFNVTDKYLDSSGLLVLGLIPLAHIIKFFTRRQRPDTIYVRKMRFDHFSFPSGHAYTSFLVYGYLAYLTGGWLAYLLAAGLIFIIGLSRVSLGAHFPSDVLGGWLLGAIALAVVIGYINHI